MILDDVVLIKIRGNNKLNHYRELGYNTSSDFLIRIEDITETSKTEINSKCDFCGTVKKISYCNYIRNKRRGNLFSCSKKCSLEKTKKTNIERWGGPSPMSSEAIRDKTRQTNLEKWGSTQVFRSDSIKMKIMESNIERWGCVFASQSQNVKEKIKKTNIERFGVDNPSKSKNVKEKIKKTNLERWGAEFYSMSASFRENKVDIFNKIRMTNLEKYGNDHPSKSELYRKKKTAIANHENYIEYIGDSYSLFKCDLGNNHTFDINIDNYISRKKNNIPICTTCNPIGDSQSIKESELFRFIKSIYSGKIIQSYRDGLEIDIYLPDMKLGFEFNGLYFHSEKFKDKWYHLNKTNYFKERDIRIIHIWEDDWSFRNEIIKSQIKNWLEISDVRIFARKCVVREIKDSRVASKFLDECHIQGKTNSNLKLGLYYKDEVISIMTFDHNNGRNKISNDFWNLNRFCNKRNTVVVGGFSKLLSFFIKNYKVDRIISYADRDWSNGDIYLNNNFNIVFNNSAPDYKYIHEDRRVHKSRFKKDKLGIKGQSITEREYTDKLGIKRIWDCGKIKFEKIINT
jgi:hypothetical protein